MVTAGGAKMNKVPGIDEHAEQSLLFEWAVIIQDTYPELKYLHAIPSGAKLPYHHDSNGKRVSIQGARLKREGLKRGIPDICLPVPRGNWHGLYIELKRSNGGRLTPEQLDCIIFLNGQGYFACICNGFENAKAVIEWYINQPKWKPAMQSAFYPPPGAIRPGILP